MIRVAAGFLSQDTSADVSGNGSGLGTSVELSARPRPEIKSTDGNQTLRFCQTMCSKAVASHSWARRIVSASDRSLGRT